MATVIAILNSKGGTGKTTLATNIAGCLHRRGHSVLIVDSDPQGSARDWYESCVRSRGAGRALRGPPAARRPCAA